MFFENELSTACIPRLQSRRQIEQLFYDIGLARLSISRSTTNTYSLRLPVESLENNALTTNMARDPPCSREML